MGVSEWAMNHVFTNKVEQRLRHIRLLTVLVVTASLALGSLFLWRARSEYLPGCLGLSLSDVDEFQQAAKDLPGSEVTRFDTCYSEDGNSSLAVRVSGVGVPGVEDGPTFVKHLVEEFGVSDIDMSDTECLVGKFGGNWVSLNVSELAKSKSVGGTISITLSDWRPSVCAPI